MNSSKDDKDDENPMKGMTRESIKELANRNVHYASYYKKKLAAEKKEVRALKSITKQWMMSDHKKDGSFAGHAICYTKVRNGDRGNPPDHALSLEKKLEQAERASLDSRLGRPSSAERGSAHVVTVGGLRKHNAMRSSSVPSETSEKENAGENSARVSV